MKTLSELAVLLVGMPLVLSAGQVEVRVRTGDGGPHIEVDGCAVPPRMFWGRNGSMPCALGQGRWTKFSLPFSPVADTSRGTIHLRFDKTDGGEISVRNFVVTENGSRFKTGLESAFDTPESFTNVWKIWPPKNDYVHKVENGVCRIELHPWRLGKKDPDYHFYTRDYTFRRRARYELSFEAKGEKGATWIRPSCYAVAPDGVHSAIPLGDESMDPLYASAAKAQDAGVNFVSYGIPEVWKENGLDFSAFDEITDRLIAVNPHVLLIPRVSVNAPRWWLKKNPDHRMVFADDPKAVGQWSGTAVRPDMAAVSSRAYRKIANEYIAAFCRHMMAKYPQNFAGIHPTGQNTHEWFYFDSWNKMNGWDPQTRESFRTYLGDPKAEVPSYEERRAHSRDLLLDPQTQARCIAFNRFQQQEMTDFVAELAQTCRRHTEGRKLVIFFYGYAWEFSSHRFGPANSGHYGLENLLAKGKGSIDILCSPISYHDRLKCGSAGNMSAGETVMRRGVLWLNEDDSRTYLTRNTREISQEGSRVTEEESRNVMLRNTVQEAIRGFGSWWMDLPGEGWYNSKSLWDVQKTLMPLEKEMLARERPFEPEVALIQDEESMIHVATESGSVAGRMISAMRSEMNRTGAPHGQYLLFDVIRRPLHAKLQIFQSAWALSDAKVDELVRQRQVIPAVRVWCYAPGWRDEKGEVDLARMKKLTGFTFIPHKGKRQEDGVFTVASKAGDEVLARFPDGAPSLVVRRNAWGGRDVFLGDPGALRVKQLRQMVDLAGVRSYLPADEIGKATLWAADLGGTHVLSLQALETGILHVQTGEGDVFDALTNEKVGMGPTLSLDLIANQVRVLKW